MIPAEVLAVLKFDRTPSRDGEKVTATWGTLKEIIELSYEAGRRQRESDMAAIVMANPLESPVEIN